MKVVSQYEIIKVLEGVAHRLTLSQGGGNWSAIERENCINAVSGMLKTNKCFVENKEDPAIVKWSTELETLLKQSEIEQTCFDFKIGFYDFMKKSFNQEAFNKTIKTLTAMANRGKGKVGYVIVGIADKPESAKTLEKIDKKYKAISKEKHLITGVEFDVDCSSLSLDRYFQTIIQELDKQPIEEDYKAYIGSNIRFLKYGEKNVIVFKVEGLSSAAMYADEYYDRHGSNIDIVKAKDIKALFDRFA